MRRSPGALVLAVTSLVAAATVQAAERVPEPYVPSVAGNGYGLLLGASFERRESNGEGPLSAGSGFAGSVEIGPTFPVGYDRAVVKALLRQRVVPDFSATTLMVGYRGYFGEEALRTFWDLDGVLHMRPKWRLGPRIGIGLQWDQSKQTSFIFSGASQMTGGQGWRFGIEVAASVLFHL